MQPGDLIAMLDEIIQSTRDRIEHEKSVNSLKNLKDSVETLDIDKSLKFNRSLKNDNIAFICEIKRASPSAGIISDEFPYVEIAKQYERAGAAAISVLTEPKYFLGDYTHLSEIRAEVNIPILRKDFIIDEYQLYQSKLLGADAVLLISSLFDMQSLKKMISLCNNLGISALVEAHTPDDIHSAIAAGAEIIGVNNRNLNTFNVDMRTCMSLRNLVPRDLIFVAESGIKTRCDIEALEQCNVNAVLIGEALMRSQDKCKYLNTLRGCDIE